MQVVLVKVIQGHQQQVCVYLQPFSR